MARKLYKYIGPDILDVAFIKDGFCGFKFSYPKDYNDPYELFLTIDFEGDSDIIAFYNEIVQEIPQHPTTCFSKSPIVTPMWAHYAHNSEGFVIEVDEEKLKAFSKAVTIDDVKYQDAPREELSLTLQMAMYRGKPRDIMFLREGVRVAAYYTKNTCWSYELERRVVVTESEITPVAGNMIMYIPTECVTSIIAGPRIKPEYFEKGQLLSDKIGCLYYSAKVGRSVAKPYFLDSKDNTYVFNDEQIESSSFACMSCKEPVAIDKSHCPWCSISEHQRRTAADKNPLRALADAGILEEYVQGFYSIRKDKN
ncbi:DUF2971 domain-containing protein [Aeromonas veronii]|uniref:DUF2971 domain-containing protein n=1 Tax=Aeromonas veronii TaxID=654 RepID=UPI0013E01C92|nr:DUF2971 domain-containing protein [Aeromonas veronii]QIF44263.1 DUF2971 domain-containing protein [Aeromonas veronii]